MNGNGRKSIIITHWNIGSKKWCNKVDLIQSHVDLEKPDLTFISEANMYESTPVHETLIVGYRIIKPRSVNHQGLSRIILLVKENIEVSVEEKLMDETVASIWVKVSTTGMRKTLVCGVYREHQFLHQQTDLSLQPQEQIKRWKTFLSQVEKVSNTASCNIIGDFNLDYIKWSDPDFRHSQMVESTKSYIGD